MVAASDTASKNTYFRWFLKPGIWSDVELLKQRNRRQDNDVQKRLAMISYDDHDGDDEHDGESPLVMMSMMAMMSMIMVMIMIMVMTALFIDQCSRFCSL